MLGIDPDRDKKGIREIQTGGSIEEDMAVLQAAVIRCEQPGVQALIAALEDLSFLRTEIIRPEDFLSGNTNFHSASTQLILLVATTIDESIINLLNYVGRIVQQTPALVICPDIGTEPTAKLIHAGADDLLMQSDLMAPERCLRTIEKVLSRHERSRFQGTNYQHDSLTGLSSRSVFLDRLEQLVIRRQRDKGIVAVLLLDIDHFKNFNENFNHEDGDRLLVKVAERLQNKLRKADTIARLGGDEFAIIIDPGSNMHGALKVADNIIDDCKTPLSVNGKSIYITLSIGISASVNGDVNSSTMLKQAEIALYKAKDNGRNNAQYFTPELAAGARVRMLVQSGLNRAFENGEFYMVYQPQIDIKSGKIVGVEALLRWNHQTLGLVPPDVFVPLLEETGRIVEVSDWIINQACRQRMKWQQLGLLNADATIAINISARQFVDTSLLTAIDKAISTLNIRPEQIDLELTETYLMENMEVTMQRLDDLKNIGVRISIDDFGTGYSSLGYLKRFPIDTIKIDKSFIENVTTDSNDAAIIQTIIGLAHNLGYGLIAEGVETAEQLEFLRAMGCESYQGYLYSRPLDNDEMDTLLYNSSS